MGILTCGDGGSTTQEVLDAINDNTNNVDKIGLVGNINNPLFDLQSKSSFNIRSGVGSVASTRASSATIKDRYGTVITKAIDEARFNEKGHLSESDGTNLCLHSEDLDDGTWVQEGGISVVPNAINASDGTLTADKLTVITGGGAERISQNITFVDSGQKISSFIDVKDDTIGKVSFRIFVFGGVTAFDSNIEYDIVNDTILESGGLVSSKRKKLIDGWTRIYYTLQNNNSGNTALIVRVSGGFTGETGIFYASKVQVEEKDFSTSYIPTTTAPVTRAGDITSYDTYDNIPNLADGFTMKWKGSATKELGAGNQYILRNYYDADNNISFQITSNNYYFFTINKGGVTVHLSTTIVADEYDEVIVRGSVSSIVEMFVNKVLISTVDMSSVIDTPLATDTFIGSNDGIPNTNAIVQTEEHTWWDFPLSDTEIALA